MSGLVVILFLLLVLSKIRVDVELHIFLSIKVNATETTNHDCGFLSSHISLATAHPYLQVEHQHMQIQ